jgi:CheY-like chemotaxis protein
MRNLPDPEKAKPCVLVVDDDDAVALAISARLGSDFRVIATTDPRRAVHIARAEPADLVLCDINMPGMKGDEVAFALSQDPFTADLPLIYLTTLISADEATELDGLFGDHPALSKSASTAEMRAMVEEALGLPPSD